MNFRSSFLRLLCAGFLLLVFFGASDAFARAERRDGGLAEFRRNVRKHGREHFKENQVFVTLREGEEIDPRRHMELRNMGYRIRRFHVLSELAGKDYFVLESNTQSTEDLYAMLELEREIEAVSVNGIRTISAVPNDPDFNKQWSLRNTGQQISGNFGIGGADISALDAWDLTQGKSSVVVAVIDTGVDYIHEDLAANMWVNSGEVPGNGVDDDGNGYVDDYLGYDFAGSREIRIYNRAYNNDSDPQDIDGHGTHVSGIVAAVSNNGLGVSGVAPNVQIMALKAMNTDGVFEDADSIEAFEYILTMKQRGVNVRVVNASWGGVGGANGDALYDAIERLGNNGVLVVAAAGNDGSDNDVPANSYYPASYDLNNIIAVAMTDNDDQLDIASNYGQEGVDIAAPGVNIFSTLFEEMSSIIVSGVGYSSNSVDYTGMTDGLTGQVYDCGYATVWSDVPSAAAGNICLIQRGPKGNPTYFYEKMKIAMDRGAAGVIFYNYPDDANDPDDGNGGLINPTLDDSDEPWIPAVFIGNADGAAIKADATDGSPPTATLVTHKSIYGYATGTSMASPHVAGVAALVASRFPGESATRIKSRILSSADPLPSLHGKVASGGRLNAHKAVLGASHVDKILLLLDN